MNISTEAIVQQRSTTESDNIMNNATNKAVSAKNNGTKGRNKEVIKAVDTSKEIVESGTAEVIQAAAPEAVIEAPVVAAAVLVVQSVPSKASKANAIFAEMFGREVRPARKDMITAVVQQAGLTPAGAATYLQNYKSKHGLVNRTPAAA